MKILVINPPKNKERRKFQLNQATRLSLELEFVNGVSIDDLPERVLQNAANEWTRTIRAVDVACTFSHWRVWEKIAAQDDKVCVLEDDVLLSENFKAVLNYIGSRQDAWHCIYDLEYAHYKHTVGKTPIWNNPELNVSSRLIYKNKRGAAAYVLGPSAAKRLLDEAKGYAMMEAFLWTRNWVQQMQIEPCPAVQLDVFDPAAKFGPQEQEPKTARTSLSYSNGSFLRAKLKRLSVSLNEAKPILLGLFWGERKLLSIDRKGFLPPDVCVKKSNG